MAKKTERSLNLSLEGRHKADIALRMVGSKRDLAAQLSMSPTTITNFFAGRAVDRQKFLKICQKLKLNWQELINIHIAKLDPLKSDRINDIVQEMREQIRPLIQQSCGTMRILDMEQPIDLEGKHGIYTDVNILDKVSGHRRLEISELLQIFNPEGFDRFGPNLREKRIPGIDAVGKSPKLMVLGKPGSGKTTFLRYLAMQCINGRIWADHLPIFVTLRDFAEADGQPHLLKYCDRMVDMTSNMPLQEVWQQGRVLLLLDGLDEVREEDIHQVIRKIRDLTDRSFNNQIVMTCRIAAQDYTFEQFTEVEVADFDDGQIQAFAENWFRVKGDIDRAKLFMSKLNDHVPIKELAKNPLLLTLLCLMFEDTTSFPAYRSELYKETLDVLLKKWDDKRKIERDQVYKKLSLKRKEDLLSQIALATFEDEKYFFRQCVLENYIFQFIRNLPDAQTDPEALHLDSEAVLKSIESHHGLLVERAKNIYSFSHLTFHEYFAAREIVELHDPDLLERLVTHIYEKRWYQVFLLTASMMRNADELMYLMKRKIDWLILEDGKLKQLLAWAWEKATALKTPYNPVAICAFYCTSLFGANFIHELANTLDPKISKPLEQALDQMLELDTDLSHTLTNSLAFALTLDLNVSSEIDIADNLIRVLTSDIVISSNLDIDFSPSLLPALKCDLQLLQEKLPSPFYDIRVAFDEWWQANGQSWIKQLRSTIIKHRNVGHDWQFSKAQKELLRRYCDANKLLIDCLNSNCYISREVRNEIEQTLLRPMKKLES